MTEKSIRKITHYSIQCMFPKWIQPKKSNQTDQKNQTHQNFKHLNPAAKKNSKSQTQYKKKKKSNILFSFSLSSYMLFFFSSPLLFLFPI